MRHWPARTCPHLVAVALVAAFSSTVAASGDEVPKSIEIAELRAADGIPEDGFGVSIAADENCVVVGAQDYSTAEIYRMGSAYVFCRSGARWHQVDQLFPSDAWHIAGQASFGYSVSIHGDLIAIGAPENRVAVIGGGHGATYLFERDDNGTPQDPLDDRWVPTAKLTSPDAIRIGDQYGFSVAVNDGRVLVGRPGWEFSSGSAYLYRRVNGVWTYAASLTPADPIMGNRFGRAVALDGSLALVGAPRMPSPQNGGYGATYVYSNYKGHWVQESKLFDDGSIGGSISIDGSCTVLGGDGDAFLFVHTAEQWMRQAKFSGLVNTGFASEVFIKHGRILIGEPGAGQELGDNLGAAHLFERIASVWVQTRMLVDSDRTYRGSLGHSVAMNSQHAFLARGDAVFVYALPHVARSLVDFASLQTCFSGNESFQPISCESFDLAPNTKINLADFAELSALFGGP